MTSPTTAAETRRCHMGGMVRPADSRRQTTGNGLEQVSPPSRVRRIYNVPRQPARKHMLGLEAPMRRFQVCLAVVVLLTAAPLFAQSKAKVQNVPEIPYDSVPNALKLPDNLYLGEGIGIATNSKGHVYVYTRSE